MGDWVDKARQFAEEHPDQIGKIADKAEEFAKERTGHRYDDQIAKGVDQLQSRLGGDRKDGEADRKE
ncbi:antitoxin [Peterkaempfera bronchialis]|uniref:Antitoxin n=1 Tax=Peterkaempfera bronchialis TaxID=2126346 RepID=A0A345T5J0_9ACTN|nr:antitoxin [Peterkaempfera bronchialis]